jgi:hypothetical protein
MRIALSLLACLAVLVPAHAADPDQHYVMDMRKFDIPIVLPDDGDRRAEIDRLILYVSIDRGKSWQKVAEAQVTARFFHFSAPQDGVYWFNVQAILKNGRADPNEIGSLPPALKVVVETNGPLEPLAVKKEDLEREIAALRAVLRKLERQLTELEDKKTSRPMPVPEPY